MGCDFQPLAHLQNCQVARLIFENPVLERLVTIKSDNEELSKLFLILFKQYGANIIVDKDIDVTQKVTFNLENVPLKVALDEIMGSLGYGYKKINGNIIKIAPADKLKPPSVPITRPKPPERLETISFTLRYAPVSKVKEILQPLISQNGKIIGDERTKSIIIMDTPETLAFLREILDETIKKLDVEIPEEKPPEPSLLPKVIKQVIRLNYADPEKLKAILMPLLSQDGKIETIEETASPKSGGGFEGIDLGTGVGRGGYLVVTDTPETVAQIEREIRKLDVPIPQVEIEAYVVETILSGELETGFDWAFSYAKNKTEISVDALGTEKGAGTLRLRYGNLSPKEFTAVLKALSNRSDTDVLASPKITVLENQQAKFHSGEQVGFSKITIQEGIQTVETIFKDVGIVLTVSPQVKEDGMISLLINVRVSSLGEATPTGEPTISNREAQTQVLVRDGDTVVIGGLSSNTSVKTVNKIPLLGDIPLLGRLFRWSKESKKKTDVTIFITPCIVKI